MSEAPQNSPFVDGQPSVDGRILIFSRDFDTRLLLETLLEMWGCRTHVCDSLEKTLHNIAESMPSLILVDSVLPFERHLENIRQIRRRCSKQLPIIVISGFSQQEFKNLSMEVGGDGFLVKPLDFDLLESFIRQRLEVNSGQKH